MNFLSDDEIGYAYVLYFFQYYFISGFSKLRELTNNMVNNFYQVGELHFSR